MEKQILVLPVKSASTTDFPWVDLEAVAHVRLTCEEPAHPIEAALRDGSRHGWKAAQPGPQTIWLNFPAPQAIEHIHLLFEGTENRTQEFVLLCSSDGGATFRELVRQQFNFSAATPREEENYFPNIAVVTDLKLTVIPDISGGDARATLRAWRIR